MPIEKDVSIALLWVAISLGLLFASLAMGCADLTAYKNAEWHHYTKEQERWSP
jgi:hypothetical protein